MRFTKITIIKEKSRPDAHNINELLQWLGGSLGLFNLRDKDKSCYRVFLALLKDCKGEARGLTSDEIALMTKLTRGTVVHHLHTLMDAGIVISDRGYYALRVDNLEQLVTEVQANINGTFETMKDVAKFIDKQLDR
jgi:predicted transcriptional regulator